MRKSKSSVWRTPARAQPSTGSAAPWRLFSFVLIAATALCAASCRSKAALSCPSAVPAPVAVVKTIPVPVDGDSATLEVRLRADGGGAILMETLHQETSKRMTLQARLDSLGTLRVKARRSADTVRVEGRDSLIYVPVPGPQETVEVNVLTAWQEAMTRLGTASLLLLAALGAAATIHAIIKRKAGNS